jgi:hypothetical protein
VGYPDPTTPVAFWEDTQSDGTTVIGYSRWSGTGSIDDVSTWEPRKDFVPPDGYGGGNPGNVATGPKGVFVLYYPRHAGSSKCGPVPEIVRYDPTTDTFGAPVPVDANPHTNLTDCSYSATSIFGPSMALAEDGFGVLHVLYGFNSGSGPAGQSTPQGFMYSVSFDGGKTFSAPVEIAPPGTSHAGMRLAVNDVGGGIVAFNDGLAQNTPLEAIWLPPLSAFLGGGGGGGGGGCQSVVQAGPIRALATQGCWTRSGSTYTASGPIKLNGIDMLPPTGGETDSQSAAVPTLSIDTVKDAISSAAEWDEKIGSVDLGAHPVDWRVPPQGGQLLQAASGAPVMLTVRPGQQLLGLPVLGTITPSLLPSGTSSLPVNVQLPDPLSGIAGGGLTDDLNLTADDAQGLHLSRGSIQIQLPEVDIGPASIDPFSVTYDADPYVFEGDLGVQLPGGLGLRGHLLIRNGELVDLAGQMSPPSPGIPVAGDVFLTRVGFHLHHGATCAPADQTNFGLDASLSGGPSIAGFSLLGIDGGATFYLPKGSCNLPARFRISGTGKLLELPVANIYFELDTPPVVVSFGADLSIGDPDVAAVDASVTGGIDFGDGAFFLRGQAGVHVLGYEVASVDAVGGSIGVGACAKLFPIPAFSVPPLKILTAGAAYTWDDGHLALMPDDCDVSFLVPSEFQAQAKAADAAPTVRVAPGTKAETFLVYGSQHAPSVTLSGPGGVSISSPTAQQEMVQTDRYVALALDGIHETAITVHRPAAGVWTVTAAGTEPVTEVRGAASVSLPRVTAHVRRLHGGRFRLGYRVRGGSRGLVLRLFQRASNGSMTVIGKLHAGAGTLTFRPAGGPPGLRQVVLDAHAPHGISATAPVIAHFVAPRPARPARPRHVKLARAAGGVRVSWRTAPGAARYVVRATLYDGREQELPVAGNLRSVLLRGVPGPDYGRILVYAVSQDRRLSVPASARLSAAKIKPKHRRHGKKRHRRKR